MDHIAKLKSLLVKVGMGDAEILEDQHGGIYIDTKLDMSLDGYLGDRDDVEDDISFSDYSSLSHIDTSLFSML